MKLKTLIEILEDKAIHYIKIPAIRPRTDDRNKRTLPHKDTTISINTMGKKSQTSGRKTFPGQKST